MRVIAGSHRATPGWATGDTLRPTSDKVREALFSILGTRIPGSRFLDLYAGTGAVGIEALSRGATIVTFVESDPKAVQIMRKNLMACGMLNQAVVVAHTDVFAAAAVLGRPIRCAVCRILRMPTGRPLSSSSVAGTWVSCHRRRS